MERYKGITHWMDYFMRKFFPKITQDESDNIEQVLQWPDEQKAAFMMAKEIFEERMKGMDKQIRKIEKETKKTEKDLKHLEKMDKKRDKFVDAGKKSLKNK